MPKQNKFVTWIGQYLAQDWGNGMEPRPHRAPTMPGLGHLMFYRCSSGITHVVIPHDDAAMDDELPALCGEYLGPSVMRLNLLSGKVCRFCRGIYFRNRKLRKDRSEAQGDAAGLCRVALRPGPLLE